ncbi:hypothetical protein NUW58_g5098 [Xylaria curta]|uniref:Uncharacterized protein n=1 Tax=Xylaria curta TaxID=42375 RepID=A0ACC1P5I0_9PEZI|nr:hypothetical protein NUW58_g5098 [Xylaria curta]
MFQHQQPTTDLASTYRELYRARFRADVQAGTATPFVLPLHLLAYWIVPTLYLAIPHRNRPWLYHARWLVLAFVCTFNWYIIKRVSSLNFVSSYGAGFLAAWATIWNFTLLVENDHRLGKPSSASRNACPSKVDVNGPQSQVSNPFGPGRPVLELDLNGSTSIDKASGPLTNGLEVNVMRKRELHTQQSAAALESTGCTKGTGTEQTPLAALHDDEERSRLGPKADFASDKFDRENEYEYYWQEYPADASFCTRLGWAFDIVSSFRLTGWNWAPSCLPSYEPPPRVGLYQLPLEYGSHRSRQGYIIIDLCATLMTTDPYFVVGPEHNYPLPVHLATLHSVLLSFQRTILAFVGIIVALQYAWNSGAICLALCCPPILGFRAHPWHLPSMMGSFTQVMDRGLSGFWGAWWHQTFQVGFSAPTKWLLRHGYLPSSHETGDGNWKMIATALGAVIAFAQSGLIHGAGSFSTVPQAHYWSPPLFFALSGLGTILQSTLSSLLRSRIEKVPRWVRRLGNLVFVILWLWATGWILFKARA